MILLCLLLRAMSFGRSDGHKWKVAWNDDDVCARRCGAIRNWPSHTTQQPWQLSRDHRRINRANAA